MADINRGDMSGHVVALEPQHGDWGRAVEITLRVFSRSYQDRNGVTQKIEPRFVLKVSSPERRPNPIYDDVASLEPGDWVSLEYEATQRQYEKNGQQRTWDQREITRVFQVRKGQPREQAPQGGVDDHVPF